MSPDIAKCPLEQNHTHFPPSLLRSIGLGDLLDPLRAHDSVILDKELQESLSFFERPWPA